VDRRHLATEGSEAPAQHGAQDARRRSVVCTVRRARRVLPLTPRLWSFHCNHEGGRRVQESTCHPHLQHCGVRQALLQDARVHKQQQLVHSRRRGRSVPRQSAERAEPERWESVGGREAHTQPADHAEVSERSERALRKTRILATMNQHPRNGYRHNGYIHY